MLSLHDIHSLAGLDDNDLYRIGMRRAVKRYFLAAAAANVSEVAITPTDPNYVVGIRIVEPNIAGTQLQSGFSQDAATGTDATPIQTDWQFVARNTAIANQKLPGVLVQTRNTVVAGYTVFAETQIWNTPLVPRQWSFLPIYLVPIVTPALIWVIKTTAINNALDVTIELVTFPVERDVMQRDTKGSWFQPFIGERVMPSR